MKFETIYTIPVNDAFEVEGGCPICRLFARREAELIDYYLGPSLMEADVRSESNKYGFCHKHLTKMYSSRKNPLGFSLILNTHLAELKKDLAIDDFRIDKRKFRFMSKSSNNPSSKMCDKLREKLDSCLICQEIEKTVARYIDVIFYLYFSDQDFANRFKKNSEFCLEHFHLLLSKVDSSLSSAQRDIFIEDLLSILRKELMELEVDTKYFSDKFDYRNKDLPWNNAKSASLRTIDFLTSSDSGEPRYMDGEKKRN